MKKFWNRMKEKLNRKTETNKNELSDQFYAQRIHISEETKLKFKQYLTETIGTKHIIDLNEKNDMPENFIDIDVGDLTNLAYDLIKNDQIDAKLIGDLLIR